MRGFVAGICFFVWVVFPASGFCDPSPFGLEIGKPVTGDLKARYGGKPVGINKYSGGKMQELDVSKLLFEGLKSALLIEGKDGRLLAVICKLDKSRFNSVLESLKVKYKAVSSSIPFVGDKLALFSDGDTEITLNAPHLSFAMDLAYVHKDFMKVYKEQSAEEERQKKKGESSKL